MISVFRPEGSGEVRYAESSMCNGFGLRYMHKFFNLPYLQLQVQFPFEDFHKLSYLIVEFIKLLKSISC